MNKMFGGHGQKALVHQADVPGLDPALQERVRAGCEHCGDQTMPLAMSDPTATFPTDGPFVLCADHARQFGEHLIAHAEDFCACCAPICGEELVRDAAIIGAVLSKQRRPM